VRVVRCAVAIALLFATAPLFAQGAEPSCPRAVLPAYAHNDYENARPLADALRLGFRGIEADVFLVGDSLRVGHDRRRAQRAATLEALYLQPLHSLIARCGRLTADGQPFLLALELKERSHPTYASLLKLLSRYRTILTPQRGSSGQLPSVEVVLVGWHPPSSALRLDTDGLIRLQHHVTRPEDTILVAPGWVRMLSLDYGKTMRRPWVTPARRRRWLAALREAKQAVPERLLRVHNLPADSALYAELLDAGVDLIGTKQLVATRRLLLASGGR